MVIVHPPADAAEQSVLRLIDDTKKNLAPFPFFFFFCHRPASPGEATLGRDGWFPEQAGIAARPAGRRSRLERPRCAVARRGRRAWVRAGAGGSWYSRQSRPGCCSKAEHSASSASSGWSGRSRPGSSSSRPPVLPPEAMIVLVRRGRRHHAADSAARLTGERASPEESAARYRPYGVMCQDEFRSIVTRSAPPRGRITREEVSHE